MTSGERPGGDGPGSSSGPCDATFLQPKQKESGQLGRSSPKLTHGKLTRHLVVYSVSVSMGKQGSGVLTCCPLVLQGLPMILPRILICIDATWGSQQQHHQPPTSRLRDLTPGAPMYELSAPGAQREPGQLRGPAGVRPDRQVFCVFHYLVVEGSR